MNNQKLRLVILCITTILLLIPSSVATYDVVSGIASNNTEYTTSASYEELHNLTLATGTGTTFLKASWDARVNFTAPLYGRFMRDGVSLGRFNLTQSVYAQVGSYEIAFNETTGTHYYGLEVYSNKKGTIYSRNFSVVFLKNGSYGTGTGGSGNITSITGAPAGVLDCTGTDEITCTVTQATTGTSGYLSSTDWNAFNSKITNATAQINRSQVTGQEGVDTTQNASNSALQSNDTYFNGSIFPNSTQFRNDSINTKEPAISSSTASKFYGWDKTFKDILISYVSGLQETLNAMNYSSASNNTASVGRDNAINATISIIQTNETGYEKLDGSRVWTSDHYANGKTLYDVGNIYTSGQLAFYLKNTTFGLNYPNSTVANAVNCSALGSDYVSRFNGTTWACYQDQTSSFSLNIVGGNAITGAALLVEGTGVDFTQSGSNITISMPAAGITNESVSPQHMNASNLTSGTVPQARLPSIPEANLTLNYSTHAQNHTLNGTDHTGNLNYSRVDNVRVNLTSGVNVTGQLPDANLASTFVKTVSGTAPIVSSGGVNPTLSLTTTWSEQQNFTGGINVTGTIQGDFPNSTQMSNPATADLNMNGKNITNTDNITDSDGDGYRGNEACSYVIYQVGSTAYARNCITSKVDYSGTNATIVMQNVQTQLGDAQYKRTIVMIGNFTLSLNLVGNLVLDLQQAYLTSQDPVNGYLIQTYNSSIDIIGGTLDGVRGNTYMGGSTGNDNGSVVRIYGQTSQSIPYSVNMRGTKIKNAYNRGLIIRNLRNSLFENMNISNSGYGGIDPAVASGANNRDFFSDVTFRSIIIDGSMDFGISPGISDKVLYDDVTIINTIYNPGHPNSIPSGFVVDRGHNITISNCNVKNNAGYGILILGLNATSTLDGNKITNCISSNNTYGGYSIRNSEDVILSNSISTGEEVNLDLRYNQDGISAQNNIFTSAKNESINIYGHANTTSGKYYIGGNLIKNWNTSGKLTTGGINISSITKKITVTGNRLSSDISGNTGIYIESGYGSSDVREITGNTYNGVTYPITGTVTGSSSINQNYGVVGYFWGIFANCDDITPFGSTDRCYNSTEQIEMQYDGSVWRVEISGNQSYVNLLKNSDFESWGSGATSVPNSWYNIGVNFSISRNNSIVQTGNYGATITANNTGFRQQLEDFKNITYYRGKQLTFSAWVYTTTSSRVKLRISDNTGTSDSSLHGGSGWEYIKITRTISSTATYIRPQLFITSGTNVVATIDSAMMVEGTNIPIYSSKFLEDDGYSVQINSTSNNVTIPNLITTNLTVGNGTITAMGRVPLHFYNGTNNISIGASIVYPMAESGIITSLRVVQLNKVACTGNITITNFDTGAYKTHIAWSNNDTTSSGLSATFTAEESLLYNITENTGCKDLTFRQVHTKTS